MNQPVHDEWTAAAYRAVEAYEGVDQRTAADKLKVSQATVHRWQQAKENGEAISEPRGAPRRALQRFMNQTGGPASESGTARAIRNAVAKYEALAEELVDVAPVLAHLDWLPPLVEHVVKDPRLSGAEKQGLIAELNAVGTRYWAISAEWASGQRGVAMQKAEVASGERAKASGEAEKSASARALAFRKHVPAPLHEQLKDLVMGEGGGEEGQGGKRKRG